MWVDFLFNAQGEDVVSGRCNAHGHDELATVPPAVWAALQAAARQLEEAFGGTSPAAVVARQLGKVCLISCAELQIDEVTRTIRFGDTTLHKSELLTLDGNDGTIYAGAVLWRKPGEVAGVMHRCRG